MTNFRYKRHVLALVVLAIVAVIVLAALGVFAANGFKFPYRTAPAPKVPPGQVKPNPKDCKHVLGGCLPQTKAGAASNSASITATKQGPDLSNNDPASCGQVQAMAKHNAYLILKVSEGTGFVDGSAAGMASCGKAHGLVVGGYDFLHICLDNPTSEANLAAQREVADGMVGKHTLPLTGDAEWPSSTACNVRTWLQTWASRVHTLLKRWPQVYTGAWWWNPHVGFWWLPHALAWVSGYTSFPPPMPSGRSKLDLWQYTDHGWNGATTSDLSVWRDGAAAFSRYTSSKLVHRVSYAIYPLRKYRLKNGVRASERNTVKTWDRVKCRNPVRKPTCKATHYHLQLVRDRIMFLARNHLVRGHWKRLAQPRWTFNHLGARNAGIWHRLEAK